MWARLTAPPPPQSPVQWKSVSFPEVKRPGRGADHPLHIATRLKDEQSYTSTPPLALQGLFWGQLSLYLLQMRVIRSAPGFKLPIYKGLNGQLHAPTALPPVKAFTTPLVGWLWCVSPHSVEQKHLPWWESTYHCLVTTATVSVPRRVGHFRVDWIGHGFNKNQFPLTIPLLQLRYIKVIENEGFLPPCNYAFHLNKTAVIQCKKSVYIQLYISTVIFIYIHSGHSMATCFDRRTVIIRPKKSILRYNTVSTQWDLIQFKEKVKTVRDKLLIEAKKIKQNGN